jgi:hypothetical protein
MPIQHDVVGDDIGVGDVNLQQTTCVGEGSAGEVGVEERVLKEDGGSEAHGDEAPMQRAGARESTSRSA